MISFNLVAADKLNLSSVAFDLDCAKKMSETRQIEFLKGRFLLRAEAAKILKSSPKLIEFAKVGRKLHIVGPKPLECSLAHTQGWFAYAIANTPIGIDVELLDRQIDMLRIAKRYFHQNEYSWVIKSSKPDRAALKLWTAKEAYVKCLGSTLAKELGRTNFDSNWQLPGYKAQFISENNCVVCLVVKV